MFSYFTFLSKYLYAKKVTDKMQNYNLKAHGKIIAAVAVSLGKLILFHVTTEITIHYWRRYSIQSMNRPAQHRPDTHIVLVSQ